MDAHALQVLGYDELKQVLLRFAPGELSRELIERLAPSSDPERLRVSLDQVGEARRLLDHGLSIPVRGLRDIATVLATGHRQNRALEPEELLKIEGVLAASEAIRNFLSAHAAAAVELHGLSSRLPDLRPLQARIEAIVEPPGVVKDRASPRLFDLRSRFRGLEERIRTVMSELASGPRFKNSLMERTFSLRNGRFVLPVKLEKRASVPGILHDKSASGGTAFIEPDEIVALSNDLAEVRIDEAREVAHLLLEISKPLYAEAPRLKWVQDVLAWIEFTAARGAMSIGLGHAPARLVAEPVLNLRSGRHPLLDDARRRGALDHDVVPVTVTLGADFRMLVVTGPNTGGKTVALKTVGLIQLMFQSGLHVPAAAGTELPCFEDIHADIGDEQSLSQSLSTFSGHVRNIARILSLAGPRSLVFLDELGAGTDPIEGAALGQAVLDVLRERRALTMVTTHLGVLKSYAFSNSDVENACVTFDVETLRPTFELVVGLPGASQALVIAARHGLDPAVIAAARRLVGADQGRSDDLMNDLMVSRTAAEEARRRSEVLVLESEARLASAKKAHLEAEAERARLEREAESEMQRALDTLRAALRPHLNALKNVPKPLVADYQAIERLIADRTSIVPFADRRREFLRDLKKNDLVYVPRFGQVCRIEKMNRADERLAVRVGQLSMDIAFDDISWVTPPDAPRSS